MTVNLRNAAPADYSAVQNIMVQVQNLHVEWRPDVYKPSDVLIEEAEFTEMVENGTLFVAETDNKVIGLMGIMYRHVENNAQVTKDIAFIHSMAVDKDYRGLGVGHLLFDRLRQLKKEKKFDAIELQVNARNAAAYEMYRNYGFREKSINMELPDIALTKATMRDFDRITDFYKDVIARTPHMADKVLWKYGLHPSDDMIREYIDASAMYIVCEDGEMLAALAVTPRQEEDYHEVKWQKELRDDEVAVVHILCVNPDKQGQGLAGRVMNEVLINARMAHKKAVRLDALYCNTPAHKLYEALGFVNCGTQHWYTCNIGWTDFVLYEYLF